MSVWWVWWYMEDADILKQKNNIKKALLDVCKDSWKTITDMDFFNQYLKSHLVKVVYAELLLEYFWIRKYELRTESITQDIQSFMPFILSVIDVEEAIIEYKKTIWLEWDQTTEFKRAEPAIDMSIFNKTMNYINEEIDRANKSASEQSLTTGN